MDYPAAAIGVGEQGRVGFRLDISAAGAVTGCTVTASSGSAILDETTCRVMATRMRFHPARDSAGKPMPDTYSSGIRWSLPPDSPPPAPQQ
jgi:protein TonB